jgi:hypothetical protein
LSDIPKISGGGDAKMKAILVLSATVLFVIAPFLTPGFAGFASDQLTYPVGNPAIQPAGYAFAIWGIIYAWLLVSAGFGLVKRDTDPDWDAGRWPLFISLAIGASWIAVALSAPISATVLIIVMLITALWALFKAPAADIWYLAVPLGLYAGWLSAASFVALATVLIGSISWLDAATGSWIGLIAALIFASAVQSRLRTPSYGIAFLWALLGIIVENASGNVLFAGVTAGGMVAFGAQWLRQLRG